MCMAVKKPGGKMGFNTQSARIITMLCKKVRVNLKLMENKLQCVRTLEQKTKVASVEELTGFYQMENMYWFNI